MVTARSLFPLIISGALTLWGVVSPEAAEIGGGTMPVPQDDVGETVDALHLRAVAKARALGLTVATAEAARATGTGNLQYPLLSTSKDREQESLAISNHVDLDPAAGTIKDFACGTRTYDGHQGTDIFLAPYTWRSMDRKEVQIVAALGGVIVEKRDGEFDRQCQWLPDVKPNYVAIRQDDGLMAYYLHMKKGTVTAKAIGARVKVGEVLGFVGSSGRSSGPHLHFEIRSIDNKAIEPNVGACKTGSTRWTHQGHDLDTAVIGLATFDAAPPAPGNCSDPTVKQVTRFAPGQSFIPVVYLRDQPANTPATFSIYRPDGSLYATANGGFPSSGFYRWAWWWVNFGGLPADAPSGVWRLRASIGTSVTEQAFTVESSLRSAAVGIAVSPATATVRAGGKVALTLTVNNTGTARAVGCRVSIARPLRATLDARPYSGGSTVGARNQAFNVPGPGNAKVKVVLTTDASFAAKSATFPLRVTCANTTPQATSFALSSR